MAVDVQGPVPAWGGLAGLLSGARLARGRRTRNGGPATGVGWLLLVGLCPLFSPALAAEDELGLRVAPGFRVTVYADESLANDTYAMTLDARGRVVVTTRGAVRTLHDTKQAGRADMATVFAETATGGLGLCFDGPDLLFCGDGWLSRYRDADGDGRADGPPERLVPLAFTEHGGHAVRKGPDGFWYVIAGNSSGLGRVQATVPRSPIRDPEAGGMLRLTPDGRGREIIAQGFRNPCDFDFGAAGDLFTYDSDVERDFFLPWYSPTRVYHVGYAQHHGWRLEGHLRSWARPDDSLDTVPVLWPVGRGSPTGVACYRHSQFPEHYRGGLFALDWTFGKVYFFPLRPSGTTYETAPEVFLEPTGTHGFAPTDVEVAPDGALLVSIGGRKTRGAVYRIVYEGPAESPKGRPISALAEVLEAPQPLEAWSRARWEPIARELGEGPFRGAVTDDRLEPPARVRAVEILTECFGGLGEQTAQAGARSPLPLVRARVAWSLGRAGATGARAIVVGLASDSDPRVRLAALETLADRYAEADAAEVVSAAVQNLGSVDRRIRLAAARLAALLPEEAWSRVRREARAGGLQARLTMALAEVERTPAVAIHEAAAEEALAVLLAAADPELRFQAVRLIVRALGDYRLKDPAVEFATGYSLQPSLRGHEALVTQVCSEVRRGFPAGRRRLDEESARLLAMLEDDDPGLPARVAGFWTDASTPTSDLHYLAVFARLKGPHGGALTPRVAGAVLALDRKLHGQELRNKQSWNDRLVELVACLEARDPALASALLEHPEFPSPAHVSLALGLDRPLRRVAAKRFLEAAGDDEFAWSGPLIQLLAELPAASVRPLFRRRWVNFGLREALLLALADPPEEADRDRFLWGLESGQAQVVAAALGALERLPLDPRPEAVAVPLRLLRRLLAEPREAALRRRTLELVARQSGGPLAVSDPGSTASPAVLRERYRPVLDRLVKRDPALAAALGDASTSENLEEWTARLKRVDWAGGDVRRGEALFTARACQTCHAGARSLGPDLAGVAGRFSPEDLFTAIVAPGLDVSPAYRTTLVAIRDGRQYSGMIAFTSADGIILQTGATTTLRIATVDIVEQSQGNASLMPAGLLRDLKPGDLADLYAYLRSLSPRPGPGPSPGARR